MALPEIQPIGGSAEEIERGSDRERRKMLEGAIDVHTHLWPEGFYSAILKWFDDHAWKISFRGTAEAAVELLRERGLSANTALVYAHKPGIARMLNTFLAEICRAHPSIAGAGTVLPGEPDAREIVREAIGKHGLRGIKLHCHVQCIAIDEPRTMEVLGECEALGAVAVVHAGREPRAMSGYRVDPYEVCGVSRTENVLRAFPKLKLVIPHLGLDEISEHLALLERYENLYLDTAMACADYFPIEIDYARLERHSDRILYGSDFPITPFDDPARELRILARRIVSDDAFERIVRGNARRLWGL